MAHPADGYPIVEATRIALGVTRQYLEQDKSVRTSFLPPSSRHMSVSHLCRSSASSLSYSQQGTKKSIGPSRRSSFPLLRPPHLRTDLAGNQSSVTERQPQRPSRSSLRMRREEGARRSVWRFPSSQPLSQWLQAGDRVPSVPVAAEAKVRGTGRPRRNGDTTWTASGSIRVSAEALVHSFLSAETSGCDSIS